MGRLGGFWGRALLALLLVAVGSHTAAGQRRRINDYRSRLDTTFSFDRNGSGTVSAGVGSINIVGWSRDQVHVRADGSDNVRLDGSSSRMTLNINGRRGDVNIEVSVPIGVRVSASTHSGSVSIRGTRGTV